MEPESGGTECAVCGEPAVEAMSAVCHWCDGRYHLNQRNDMEAKDCGQVWVDDQYLALRFACDNCLREAQGGASETPSSTTPAREARPRASGRPRRYRRRA